MEEEIPIVPSTFIMTLKTSQPHKDSALKQTHYEYS